ncbi:MAG TPA: phytanoyl-CoA dioxygenase family protein [Acetobacteraceae bacterium]|nr:phytanoyl-CoA dioxygenase family protein [Acetobacteraceae bacterium]
MSTQSITDTDHADFWRDGYVMKPGFLDAAEIDLVRRAIETDEAIAANVTRINDSQGASTELALWNHPGDDIFGMVARSERMVGGMEKLLGGEVYHYHSKLTMKRPHVGGAWDWHQDYGYWYFNGCLFPDMASVFIAVDPSTRENGCLEVLRGSHKMGRLEHGRVGGQTGADMERVDHAMEILERVYCVMQPGDALFFHSNTLHASSQNRSDHSRNVLLCCYNRASNNPYKEHHHPRYTKLARVPDSAIKETGLRVAGRAREYYNSAKDATVEVARG